MSSPRLSRPAAALAGAGCATIAPHDKGMVSMRSPHGAAGTVKRLEGEVRRPDLAVVARIDHAAGAAKVGKTLRPTELPIFGNPESGTPLMKRAQALGIDLPVKALVRIDTQSPGGRDCPADDHVRKASTAIAAAPVAP